MWRSNMKGVSIIVEQEGEGEDKTWELARAFAMDTNWPPRSYTCTFCKREFRSAQALGGHMNVHRRDRARLHHQSTLQAQAQARAQAHSTVTSPTSHHFYHQLADNNNCRGNSNFEVMASSSGCTNNYNGVQAYNEMSQGDIKVPIIEDELDLELRLGHIPISSPLAPSHEKLFEKNNGNNVSVLNFIR